MPGRTTGGEELDVTELLLFEGLDILLLFLLFVCAPARVKVIVVMNVAEFMRDLWKLYG